jgi:hypothetical protein
MPDLTDLRKNYMRFRGQQIETQGIVGFEFENVSICPGRNDLFNEEKKCFWLNFRDDLSLDDSLMQKASGNKFLIRGTVDISRTGHLGAYACTIRDIYFMQQK